MNKEINIAFSWPKDDISKAWSGSAYQIKRQLETNHNVGIIDTSIPLFWKRVLNKLKKHGFGALAKLIEWKICELKITGQKVSGDLFLFEPISYKNGDSYIYCDCTYRYLYELAVEDKDAYTASGFAYSIKDLEKLASFQDRFFYNCKKIFVMGKYLKDFFDCHYPSQVSQKAIYVGGGINFDFSPDESIEKEDAFLFVGKDFYRKAGDIVVKAFKQVYIQMPNTKLYIIGPVSIDEKDIDGIEFLGPLSYSDTKKYFLKSKVFVMPSRFEAYGLVFLEALTSGCIIIGQNKFEMTNFITNDNGVFCDMTVDDLADKMIRMITNDELSRKIRDNRDRYLEKSSWDSVYKRMDM